MINSFMERFDDLQNGMVHCLVCYVTGNCKRFNGLSTLSSHAIRTKKKIRFHRDLKGCLDDHLGCSSESDNIIKDMLSIREGVLRVEVEIVTKGDENDALKCSKRAQIFCRTGPQKGHTGPRFSTFRSGALPPRSVSMSSPPKSSLNLTKLCIDNLIYAEQMKKEWEAESIKLEECFKRMQGMLEELKKRNREMEEAEERENKEQRRRI
ncbi:hypothetical protein LguiA_007660 [Lonicera macranthoides]